MTVEEIFIELAAHMIEGMKFHCTISQGYDFLGLYGFSKCHEYHYFAETKGYEQLLHYYSSRYHKLLKVQETPISGIIPETWYKYTTMAVDSATKRNSIKSMMEKWIEWEKTTKKLYQQKYQELYEIGEIAAADKVKCYICDVDEELKHAEKKFIQLETVNYDLSVIVQEQQSLYKKYKKALKTLF